MKKLFGGINLTWKKLILFAVIAGIYTAVMAIIPFMENTSFRDIATYFEWWILFGIIIICNSKSPLDSALKCFVFFLISQPLIYLLQVPFSYMGWNIFSYYKYWFIWTLACLPMGYIGYYIKKNNILSVIIVLPMLIFLSYLGIGYLNSLLESFPHHLLSFIFCFGSIILIVLNLFDKLKLRLISFGVVFVATILLIIKVGILNNTFEIVTPLDIPDLEGTAFVSNISNSKGKVELIPLEESYNVRLSGTKGKKYTFEVTDESNKTYSFKYYFDGNKKTVILKKIDN